MPKEVWAFLLAAECLLARVMSGTSFFPRVLETFMPACNQTEQDLPSSSSFLFVETPLSSNFQFLPVWYVRRGDFSILEF